MIYNVLRAIVSALIIFVIIRIAIRFILALFIIIPLLIVALWLYMKWNGRSNHHYRNDDGIEEMEFEELDDN